MAKSQEDRAYDKGYEDQRQERYDPPSGTSWTTAIHDVVVGRTEADKSYDGGREAARADGK